MLKKLIWCLLPFYAVAQSSYNLSVLSHFNDPNLRRVDGDQIWNDVMGWKDTVKNREYMIAGSTDSIYFFDITNPNQMIKCDVRAGRSRNAVNRDYEVYDHYVYCVSDKTSPLGSLQIFDLQYLPDSVHPVYDNDTFSVQTHTLFIEAASKRLYLCGNQYKPSGTRAMAIFSLDNPEDPQFLGELDRTKGCGYVHEVFVQQDTAYCSCGNSGLFIFDLRNPQESNLISTITAPYPGNGYNHSSWLDSTGRYLMFTDENQGSPIKVYDIQQITAPDLVTYFNSHPQALPHNAYWHGRFAYASAYEDGVYMYDMNPVRSGGQPTVVGYYDTYPLNPEGTYNGFHGCWGVWPYLPSGVILASDMSEGLFVLKPSFPLSNSEVNGPDNRFTVSPNPFNRELTLSNLPAEICEITLFDIHGKRIWEATTNGTDRMNVSFPEILKPSTYVLKVTSNQSVQFRHLLKTE